MSKLIRTALPIYKEFYTVYIASLFHCRLDLAVRESHSMGYDKKKKSRFGNSKGRLRTLGDIGSET